MLAARLAEAIARGARVCFFSVNRGFLAALLKIEKPTIEISLSLSLSLSLSMPLSRHVDLLISPRPNALI